MNSNIAEEGIEIDRACERLRVAPIIFALLIFVDHTPASSEQTNQFLRESLSAVYSMIKDRSVRLYRPQPRVRPRLNVLVLDESKNSGV